MKKTFWTFLILVIVIIALGVWVGVLLLGAPGNGSGGSDVSPYAAVYLTSGDIYYGQLSWTPTPHLTDVWYLQKTTAPDGSAQYGIAPFTSAVWGPANELYFNQSNVLFWTYLTNDSPVARAIADPSLYQQLESQMNQAQPSSTIPVTATSTTGNASGTAGSSANGKAK